jgi:hypothetical protein
MGWTEDDVLNIMEKYHKIEFLNVTFPDSLCAAINGNILLFFEKNRNQIKTTYLPQTNWNTFGYEERRLTELYKRLQIDDPIL